MASLDVSLYGFPFGTVNGDWRTFDLTVCDEGLERFGIDSDVLSLAVPLARTSSRAKRDRRQNFFRELLPEGAARSRLAALAGVQEFDTVGLLRAHGRDVAGALDIVDSTSAAVTAAPRLESLTLEEVGAMLQSATEHPLGNAPVGGKTSLAGVQEKIVLARRGEEWCRVLDGAPSTHLAKPVVAQFPSVIYDEEYGARLARHLGLASHATWIERFGDVDAVVVERFDRSATMPNGRIHQEDFNQVLGASGNEKYQSIGGKVSLARIARVVTASLEVDSLRRLFELVVLSCAVGNLDLHAKNLSVLHPLDQRPRLAPAYDVVPMAHLPTDGQLAMAVNGVYHHAALTAADLVAEGTSWGMRDAEDRLRETLEAIVASTMESEPHPNAAPHLRDEIVEFARNLLDGRSIGPSVVRRNR